MSGCVNHVTEAQVMLSTIAATATEASGDDEVRIVLAEAQVHATLALVEQQRIANRLKVAELDLRHEIGYKALGGYALDFRIRTYLTTDDWSSVEVPEDEPVTHDLR